MNCELCLRIRLDEQLIELNGDEGQRLNAASILHKHFRSYFQSAPNEGYVCRNCWLKISAFHEFYNLIESIQANGHSELLDSEDEPDSAMTDIYSADESELNVKSTKVESVADEEENIVEVIDRPLVEMLSVRDSSTRPKRTAQKRAEPSTRSRSIKKGPTGSREFHCGNCGMNFLSFSRLDHHIKQLHDVKALKCHHLNCVESFDTQEMLDDHFARNHTRTECPHCHKMILVSYIAQHIKDRHDANKNVICDICGKVSPNAYIHSSHYQVMHEVQEKLQCAKCGDWLKNKNSMRMHLARHLQVPQTCSTCGHVSPNRKALAKHKKIHMADFKQRFKCIVCDKGFRDNTKLKEHSYIHSGVTDAYRCDHCDKAFRFGSTMYKHRKQAHPEEEKKRIRENVNYSRKN